MKEREVYTSKLSDKKLEEANEIYSRIKTIEKLITGFNLSDENELVFDKLIRDLSKLQRSYESFYTDIVNKEKWQIFPEFKWYIDYNNKVLKVVEFMKE